MKKTTDPTDGLKNYQVTNDGTVCMGTTLTIYKNTRIKAGYTAEPFWYHCDWCCGRNAFCIFISYKIMEVLLDSGTRLTDLPTMSRIKPWPLDVEFVKRLQKLLENVGYDLNLMTIRDMLLNPEHHMQLKRGF